MNKNSKYESSYFFFILSIISFLIGFFLGENSSGGGYLDYQNQKIISQSFANNFLETLLLYDDFGTRHSPILPIILGFLEYLKFDDFYIRFFYMAVCSSLPFFFYNCLCLKYKKIPKEVFIFLTSLLFLSPTFRTLVTWPDSRIIGLSFFIISIFYYLKFLEKEKLYFSILNIFFLAVSSYFSPNFSIFSIFFYYKFLKFYKLKKEIFIITLINIILAVPAFYFIIIENHNFLFSARAIPIEKSLSNSYNYFNKILIIPTILFFYLIPFLFTKIFKTKLINFKYELIVSVFVVMICLINFDYPYTASGGGIFLKISSKIFKNIYYFYIICFFSFFLILVFANKKVDNFMMYALLILSNPQLSIYHKYYDPLFLILVFTIFKVNIDFAMLKTFKNKILIYSFFSIFLIINFFK